MIFIRGAALHNLKSVNADFPINQISVVCGPSGCGKSTLVMDVLHGESQRRYLETLSPFALKVLGGRLNIPIDSATGLRPSLAIAASRGDAPSKSTALSLSECEQPLRILWAHFAEPACPECGNPMKSTQREEIIREVSTFPEGSRLQFLAPIDSENKNLDMLSAVFLAQGYTRAIADTNTYSLGDLRDNEHEIIPKEFYIVTDRIIIRNAVRTRIAEAVDATLKLTHSTVVIDVDGKRIRYSTIPRCEKHGNTALEIVPGDFSPYSLKGACKICHGNGCDENNKTCKACNGFRLAPTPLFSSFKGVSWKDLLCLSFNELAKKLPELFKAHTPEHLKNTAETLAHRIAAVEKLGIGYLTTGRGGNTLSGGELQRLRLSPLATGHLNGMLICLDEPASGLYETDVDKLWQVLCEIRDHGNTLVLIEHHPSIITRADWIVEMGPHAGELGGTILFQGPREIILTNPSSPTATWISSLAKAHREASPKIMAKGIPSIEVKNFTAFDMQPVNAHFPVGHFSVITGESGSGKSTLLFKHILPCFEKGDYQNLGFEAISILSTGSFIGNRKSSVASAIQMMTPLRELFASLPESKIHGYRSTRFGTHVPGGRCETCKGEGVLHDPSGYEESECPVCLGKRFRDEILDIRFKTLSIADILDLSIEKALSLFSFSRNFTEKLAPLQLTGLGYLHLGQPTTHLSGGERARLRLSIALSKAKAPRTLYLFDEPARGLHQEDIHRMIELIQKLCAEGHTVIAIEHQQDFYNVADYTLTLARKTEP